MIRVCFKNGWFLIGLALATIDSNSRVFGEQPQPNSPPKLPEVRFNITPAAEPSPPLKYMLVRPPSQRKPGNAASFYHRAMLLQASQAEKDFEVAVKWRDLPLEQLPKDEVRKWLATQQGALHELKTAASREYCEWDLRPQDLAGMSTISFMLHEAQAARRLATVLRIQTRLAIAEGKFDEAVACLQDGYQLARDVAQIPFLITALVGSSIASTMNESVHEFIAAPGSPNLYWALCALPQPLIDFRRGFEFELNLPFQMFPTLATAETAQHSPEEWRRLFQDSVRKMYIELIGATAASNPEPPKDLPNAAKDVAKEAYFKAATLLAYPKAKQALIQSGMDAKRVEEMPYEQVIIIQTSRECRLGYQEFFKWMLVPYSQSADAAKEAQSKLQADGYWESPFSRRGALSIIHVLMPALSAVRDTAAALERDIASLQNLEALRMHVATNGGNLPKSLDEIKVVPIALNPATGISFNYRLDGTEATIDIPAVANRKGKKIVMQAGKRKGD